MKLLLILTVILLCGCSHSESTYISNRCERQQLFKECMALLPKPAQTHYSDYDKMVEECDSVALYQTVRLRVASDVADTCVVPRY